MAQMCLLLPLAVVESSLVQFCVEKVVQEVTWISLVPNMPLFGASQGHRMVQTQLFWALVPFLWAVVLPDMESVVKEVTRISLIPHMPLFGATQGPRMVQTQLFLALVL